MKNKRFALIFIILIVLVLLSSIVAAGFFDKSGGVKNWFNKNKTKIKFVLINTVVIAALGLLIAPFAMGGISDTNQKTMVYIGIIGLAFFIGYQVNASYGDLYLWKLPLIASLLHIKPLVNIGAIFGVLFLLYSWFIANSLKEVKAAPYLAAILLIIISYNIADIPKNYVDDQYRYIWQQETIGRYRVYLFGDPRCEVEGTKYCYTEQSVQDLAEKGDFTGPFPKVTEEQVSWGIFRGSHFIFLFVGFFLIWWILEQMNLARDGRGSGHINKVIAFILAFTITTNTRAIGSFISYAWYLSFAGLFILFGVKDDLLKVDDGWTKAIGVGKFIGIWYLLSKIEELIIPENIATETLSNTTNSVIQTQVSSWGGAFTLFVFMAIIFGILTAIDYWRTRGVTT